MTSLGLYFRTLRHARPSQLLWRARYLLERRASHRSARRWAWEASRAPRVRAEFLSVPIPHRQVPSGPEPVALLARGVFDHLGQARQIGREQPDWQLGPVTQDRLWVVTLHYHGWAYDLAEAAAAGGPNGGQAASLFREYVGDWMDRCALDVPGALNLAWNSYAIATRTAWWVRSYRLLNPECFRAWGRFENAFLTSLWQQAAYLHDHLEWDLRGNHLLRDAVGLAWAGRFFDEDRAGTWLERATRLAMEEAAEQVLPDGGHFERSPMYHLQVMEELAALIHLLIDPAARMTLRSAWGRMAEWAAWMRHPDGGIPLFNDAAWNGAGVPEAVLNSGASWEMPVGIRPRRGGRHFDDSGMIAWHGNPWSVFFDVGAVGPDYQPGHAHADTLSLECSYDGERLFVDPGTYAYDDDARRRYDRSTAAHNTVCVDDQDSSEVWHIFRVGRRANPRAVRVSFLGDGLDASAAHDGYDHLPGRPRPVRRLNGVAGGGLVLADRVEGKGRHVLQAGLLVAPDWTAKAEGGGWLLENGARRVRVAVQGPEGTALSAVQCPYHPEYGRELEATRLVWRFAGELPVEVTTRIEGC